MTRAVSVLAALCAAAGLTGCSAGDPGDDPFAHYATRIMTVDETAGNTQAANAAIQTVDPWPRYVHDTRIPGDGTRLTGALENYEHAYDQSSGSSPTTAITINNK